MKSVENTENARNKKMSSYKIQPLIKLPISFRTNLIETILCKASSAARTGGLSANISVSSTPLVAPA